MFWSILESFKYISEMDRIEVIGSFGAFDEVTLEPKEESLRKERSVDRHYLLVWLDTLF